MSPGPKRSFLRAAVAIALCKGAFAAGSPKSCPAKTPLSCHNTSMVTDTCCFSYPGGLFLQTQFWDAGEQVQGPCNSWTVHGLWPDNCDGTYQQYCDPTREYTNITQILQSYNQTDLLSYMQTYWTDYHGNEESFWEHEWAKHGTCISTFDTKCYTGYTPQEEVVDFFTDTVNLYKTLPTYTWLSNAGIVPSLSKTYTSAAVLKALKKARGGVEPYISCSGGNLNEVWYYFYLKGSVQGGRFKATDASVGGSVNNCPETLTYLPKTEPATTTTTLTSSTTSTTTTSATSTSTSGPFIGKGYMNVQTSGSQDGCIISYGTWYTTGTCATFTGTASGDTGVTLVSSKGNCAIVTGVLSCASNVTTPTVFDISGNMLAYGGSTSFYATAVPTGQTQAKVETTSDAVTLQILWQAI